MENPHLRPAKARVGEKAGRYILERLIAIGGMAAVYVGTHRRDRVAVKVLHRPYARMLDARVRFARESYAANKIDHPGVARVLGDGQLADGTPFFTMELLVGSSLQGRLSRCQVLPTAEVLFVADRVLDVLALAHENGIIHRDLKPANLFVTKDQQVKVLDFGLARVLEGGQSRGSTRQGTVIGTASYMSPEQAVLKPELIDFRTDLWSLGAIMFRALAGRTVHNVTGAGPSLMAAATQSAPSLGEVTRGQPRFIIDLVDRALAYYKQDRWSDAVAMQDAVREAYQQFAHGPTSWDVPVDDHHEEPLREAEHHVNVRLSEREDGSSIVIDVEDEAGKSSRYELRRRSQRPPNQSSYELVVDLPDDPDSGR